MSPASKNIFVCYIALAMYNAISLSYPGFTMSNVVMPANLYDIMTAYDSVNDRICLIPIGSDYHNKVYYYNIKNDSFTDDISNYLPFNISYYWSAESQCYTQIKSSLYFSYLENLYEYDVVHGHFIDATSVPKYVDAPCVLSVADRYILLIGGGWIVGPALNYNQIYDTFSNSWIVGPSLLYPMARISCTVFLDYAYIFGDDGNVYRIYIGNMLAIGNESWEAYGSQPYCLSGGRVTVFDDHVYIVGACDGNQCGPGCYEETRVVAMDSNGTMEIIYFRLNVARAASGVIAANGTLYTFGGYRSAGVGRNTWEYATDLSAPTAAPTAAVPTSSSSSSTYNGIDSTMPLYQVILLVIGGIVISFVFIGFLVYYFKFKRNNNTKQHIPHQQNEKHVELNEINASSQQHELENDVLIEAKKEKEEANPIIDVNIPQYEVRNGDNNNEIEEKIHDDGDDKYNDINNKEKLDENQDIIQSNVVDTYQYDKVLNDEEEPNVINSTIEGDGIEYVKKLEVSDWMDNIVGLSNRGYDTLLISNGFDDLATIKFIEIEDLAKIGIMLVGHQRKIYKFAQNL